VAPNNWTCNGLAIWTTGLDPSGDEPGATDNVVSRNRRLGYTRSELEISGSGAWAVACLFSNATGILNVDDTG
jgi:hypothetical protein